MTELLEAERLLEERRRLVDVPFPQARAVEAADLLLDGDRAVGPRLERTVGVVGDERDAHPVRIDERQDVLAEPLLEL